MNYQTDIQLGERYVDEQTKIEGVATAISFFQHACERVTIETVIRDKIEEYVFDAPRLTSVKTQLRAVVQDGKTGGPAVDKSRTRPAPRGR